MAAQRAERAVGQLGGRLAFPAVPHPVRRQEVLGEQRDVFGPFAERGHMDRHHTEPVVQALPHGANLYGSLRIAVRRRDEPDVHHGVRRFAPHVTHHAVLDDA